MSGGKAFRYKGPFDSAPAAGTLEVPGLAGGRVVWRAGQREKAEPEGSAFL